MAEGRFSIETVFKAIDKMTAPVSRMQNKVGKFTKKLNRGFHKLNKTLQSVNQRLNKVVFGIAKAAAVGFVAAGASILKFVNEARKVEDAIAAFQPIVGGIDNAKKAVDDLNKTAATTPFQFENLASSAQLLLGFGAATQKDLIPTLRMLGDTAGGNAERLNSIALAFAQIKAGGKASMQDINQLINAGVPILGELADMWGVNIGKVREMVSQGKATGDEVSKAFQKMTSEGGRFYRGMEIASKTFSGKMSTLRDNINLTAAAIGGALMPKLKGGADRLNEIAGRIRTFVNANRELIAQRVDKFIGNIRSFFEKLKPTIVIVIQVIKNLISIFANLFKSTEKESNTLDKLIGILNFFAKILLEITEIVKVFDKMIGGRLVASILGIIIVVKLLAAAFAVLNAIMLLNPVGLIIVGIGLLVAAIIFLIRHIDVVKGLFVKMWEVVRENPILAMIFPIFSLIAAIGFLIKHWKTLKAEFKIVSGFMVESFRLAVTQILGLIDKLKKPFGIVGMGISRIKNFFGRGGDEEERSAEGINVVSPEERTAKMIQETTTTNKAELTIKDDTGRAELSGTPAPGINFKMAESGAL